MMNLSIDPLEVVEVLENKSFDRREIGLLSSWLEETQRAQARRETREVMQPFIDQVTAKFDQKFVQLERRVDLKLYVFAVLLALLILFAPDLSQELARLLLRTSPSA